MEELTATLRNTEELCTETWRLLNYFVYSNAYLLMSFPTPSELQPTQLSPGSGMTKWCFRFCFFLLWFSLGPALPPLNFLSPSSLSLLTTDPWMCGIPSLP